ncbi:permease of the drug/metabolite transporter superfamily [Aquitalea magnusonii]|uniref:Permease of the drug/metabolite transporter superfamily n=1 Tax=Aquitalea magnusonii TaxID=332411 RepID=A0A3G9GNZ6_9NEIS|nr:DMT family transporter [Aquitalea magnusonii]BBF87501.1 permease of the drug/metabolite transporter superfamily [Aquitalea magnusonii]
MTSLTATASLPPSPSRLPDLVLIGVTMIWGFTFLVVQHALQWAGPFSFVSLRFGIAGLIALLLCWRELRGLSRRELLTGALVGSVLFGSYSLQTLGLQLIPSSKSAFLTGLYVPLVPLFQLLLFRHRPRLAAWLGIIVAFGGLVLLSDPRGLQFNFGAGEWLTVAGAAMIALEISLVGRFAGQCHPRRVAVVQLLTVSLLAALGWQLSGEAAPQAHPVLLVSLLGMGLATAVIQIAMNWAQKTVPATRATIIYAMEPVWAGLVGAIAGEQLGIMAISGAALIVASVLISQLGGRRPH